MQQKGGAPKHHVIVEKSFLCPFKGRKSLKRAWLLTPASGKQVSSAKIEIGFHWKRLLQHLFEDSFSTTITTHQPVRAIKSPHTNYQFDLGQKKNKIYLTNCQLVESILVLIRSHYLPYNYRDILFQESSLIYIFFSYRKYLLLPLA